MQKEMLTQENIKKDLLALLKTRVSNLSDWRFSFIVPFTLLAVILGILLKNVWIGLLIFSPAVYHIVRYAVDARSYSKVKQKLKKDINDCSFSVTVETLDGISSEIIYEPHRSHCAKTIVVYCFQSGKHWRKPVVGTHYKWSKLYNMSSAGLDNTSIVGDTFYFISLSGDPETAYVYNTRLFDYRETA